MNAKPKQTGLLYETQTIETDPFIAMTIINVQENVLLRIYSKIILIALELHTGLMLKVERSTLSLNKIFISFYFLLMGPFVC